MSVLNNLLSPISIAFIVIIIGYYVGKIKIFKISLDLSGVLLVAVFVGWLFAIITPWQSIVAVNEYNAYMKFFSAFGTALFVSSIGISTGNILDFDNKKDIKAILVGSLMVVSAFVTMSIISLIDDNITVSKLIGSLCGALTTTPGLSAACELKNIVSQEVTLGYGCTYLFGVIATVLFAQISTRKFSLIYEAKKQTNAICENKVALSGIIQIGICVVLGRLIGSIEFFNFSLGNSGGMLCVGIIIGLITKKYFPKKSATTKQLIPFRNIGLVLFFVGNGFPAGVQIYDAFDIKMVLYGALMTIIPIVVGIVLHKVFFKDVNYATIIAGGMTSTPAICVIMQKNQNINMLRYSLAYSGALVTIVILLRTFLINA